MKERFCKRLLTGMLNVKCKNDDGSFRMWQAKKEDVVSNIVSIVEDYNSQGYNLTLRQLHYQLVSANAIVNHQTAYKKLGTILDDCRYAGIIDWDNIVDRGRSLNYPWYENSVKSALENTALTYRLERQIGQYNHVEVWTEKDALSEIFSRSTNKYGVGLCVNKGYTSSSAIYKAYERFADVANQGRKVVILYFGDHDPSGLDMIRDVRERIFFMMLNGELVDEKAMAVGALEVIPIGLTMKQIKQYKLPPNPAKLTDTRANAYIKKFGMQSWEVDALKPEVLTAIVESNIEEQIDMDLYNEKMIQEEKERKQIKSLVKNL